MAKEEKTKSQWYATDKYDEINYQSWTEGKVSSPDYEKAYDRMKDGQEREEDAQKKGAQEK